MRTAVGVALSDGSLRAVGVRGETVAWAAEFELGECEPAQITAALRDLSARMPSPSGRRPAVTVAIGPAHAQTRLISGLPPLADPVAIARIVQESAGTFFLRNGEPLITTGVRPAGETSAWAGAFAQPLVEAIVAACQEARLRLRAVVPGVVAATGAFQEGQFSLADGAVRAEVVVENDQLAFIRRYNNEARTQPDERARTAAALAHLEGEGERYAMAYGAALLSPDEPVVVRPFMAAGNKRPVPRWRSRVAIAGGVLTACIALLVPGVTAIQATNRAANRIAALADERRSAIIAERDVQRFSNVLSAVALFKARRLDPIALLAGITRILPDTTAILDLRLDSTGAGITVLGRAVNGLASTVDASPLFSDIRLVGPITTQSVDTLELQQATIRFHVVPATRAGHEAAGP